MSAQRERTLEAMVLTVGERGYARTTVGAVCTRARVSRRTFYEEFAGLQGCFLAIVDEGARRAGALVEQACAGKECWREAIRAALAALLVALDEEPLLARVWFIEALAAGDWALEHRGRRLGSLTTTIIARWPALAAVDVNPLAATGMMELVMGVIHTRLLARDREPLLELLGPLMGLIAAVYLDRGTAAVEVQRGDAHAQSIIARRACGSPAPRPEDGARRNVPRALLDPRAHRARQCLQCLVEHPGMSNREIARTAGVAHDTHISTVLARLADSGLLVKREGRPGAPNAWFVTPRGEGVARMLEDWRPALGLTI